MAALVSPLTSCLIEQIIITSLTLSLCTCPDACDVSYA